ncbi:hypothetical protein DBP12_07340 [Streptomyces sp. CS014]|nr:hypothetical protein DBP12_07340 [Streptomyces sp. CS014]
MGVRLVRVAAGPAAVMTARVMVRGPSGWSGAARSRVATLARVCATVGVGVLLGVWVPVK